MQELKQITTSFIMNRFYNHMVLKQKTILSTPVISLLVNSSLSNKPYVKNCEGSTILLNLKANKLACHCFIVLAKGMGTPGPAKKDFITHHNSRIQSISGGR